MTRPIDDYNLLGHEIRFAGGSDEASGRQIVGAKELAAEVANQICV